jgi:hypothetical protein
MTKQQKKLNSDQIRGFFEGDGGIQVRIGLTENSLSFRPLVKFGQKTNNRQILDWVKESLAPDVEITNDNTGNTSLVFPFASESGKKFIEMYLENKPINPGTLKDFLITLLIHRFNENGTLPLSTQSLSVLQSQTKEMRERMETLTL